MLHPVRCPRALPQSRRPFLLIALPPLVARHPTHAVTRTHLTETPVTAFHLVHKLHPLFNCFGFLPCHRLATVKDVAGLFCKGCCRIAPRLVPSFRVRDAANGDSPTPPPACSGSGL